MRILQYENSEDAFFGINEYMIFRADGVSKNGVVSKSQTIMYDTLIKIHKSMINPNWDFTSTVNYRNAKWTSLVNNYIDKSHFQEVAAEVMSREIKNSTSYNIAFTFSNSHGGGKGCLLTCTFSRRPGLYSPILTVTVRASEVYKRLMMDLLLVHRLGEAVYGEDSDFSIQMFFPHAWQGVSWAAMFYKLVDPSRAAHYLEEYGSNSFYEAVVERYKYFKSAKWQTFSYNADKRAAKVIQGEVAKPPLLAKHCII